MNGVIKMGIDIEDKDHFIDCLKKCERDIDYNEDIVKDFWDWMYSIHTGRVQTCAYPVPTENKDGQELGAGKWIAANSYDEFERFCSNHSGIWRYHTYAGVNTLDKNPGKGRGSISHIDHVEHLTFDIETDREPNTGASHEEVWWCYRYALAEMKYMKEHYGVLPLVVMSENGIHLHYNVSFDVTDELLVGKQHLFSKYITYKAMNCFYVNKVRNESPETIVFDQDDVSDISRIMKVPGTRGIKSETGRLCAIIHKPSIENAGIITREDINASIGDMKRKVSSVRHTGNDSVTEYTHSKSVDVSVDGVGDDLAERIRSLIRKDESFARFFRGEIDGYESRSEAELGFVKKSLSTGFKPNEIVQLMYASGMTKWDEESNHYRERTIRKAVDDFDGNVVLDSTSGDYSF